MTQIKLRPETVSSNPVGHVASQLCEGTVDQGETVEQSDVQWITMISAAVVAWTAGVVALNVALRIVFGSPIKINWVLLLTLLDTSPLVIPSFLISIPVVIWLKHQLRPKATVPMLALCGAVAAVLPLPAVVLVISGSWIASQGEQRWSYLLADSLRSGIALVLGIQYAVTGTVLGAGYGWISRRKIVHRGESTR